MFNRERLLKYPFHLFCGIEPSPRIFSHNYFIGSPEIMGFEMAYTFCYPTLIPFGFDMFLNSI